ncbi:hypothetical protein BES34_021265 [Leptospira inadai serovar Lyme]|uniref:Uncharacterized protein n=1 Tax=Leptospira inadai serovar Lyme TaxID=293084 RepID=A0ABX4YCN6_9LEPT|nr:hypothetical protein BES34_021265 [Leptospira inadai serovar Lyme]
MSAYEISTVMQEFFSRTWNLRSSMFCPQSSVFCPLKDRCARFARARQKLLDVVKVIEVEEISTVMQEFFSRTWNLRSSMFCPQSSVFCPLKDRRVRFAHAIDRSCSML